MKIVQCEATQAAIVAAELIIKTAEFIPDGTGGGWLNIKPTEHIRYTISIDREGNVRGSILL